MPIAGRRTETLRLLEAMALDVVHQLASALPTVEDPKGMRCPNKKITVRLADRRKPIKEDGWVEMTHLLTFLLIFWIAAHTVCAALYSRRIPDMQVQKPLVRAS